MSIAIPNNKVYKFLRLAVGGDDETGGELFCATAAELVSSRNSELLRERVGEDKNFPAIAENIPGSVLQR